MNHYTPRNDSAPLSDKAMIKLSNSEFTYIVDYVKGNFGIDLSKKRVLLEGRLNNYLVEQGYGNFTDYIKAVEADKSGKELTVMLNKVTTNHTYFMRESDHFNYLRDVVLPEMESRIRDYDLRFWCAAASTGEEPYTLAMILNDRFGHRAPRWDKTLLATDLSMKVLDIAKNGIYNNTALAKIPPAWKTKYFTKFDNESMQVVPELRSEIIYRRFNLMDPISIKKPFHIIFCRNVMIYFDSPTKSALADRMYDAMAPGGYLFVGLTESLPKPTRFKYIKPSVYQKGV